MAWDHAFQPAAQANHATVWAVATVIVTLASACRITATALAFQPAAQANHATVWAAVTTLPAVMVTKAVCAVITMATRIISMIIQAATVMAARLITPIAAVIRAANALITAVICIMAAA